MLLFSTVLKINERLTQDKFIELVIEWNQGSPHTSNVIPNVNWNGERNIKFGNEDLWLDIQEYRNKNIIAVRFEKNEDGVLWDTDYVADFNSREISITLDRSFTENVEKIDYRFSTPYFIALLIRNGYLQSDYELEVGEEPIFLTENNINLLADIVSGENKYSLPIVYISKTATNHDPINPVALSKKLKGIAHVIVQQTNKLNDSIRELCNGKNEYYGAIGIYYPNNVLRSRRFIYSGTRDRNYLFGRVISSVMRFNNIQQLDELLTWHGVRNSLLLDRFKSQREKRKQAAKDSEEDTRELYELLQEYEDKNRELVEQNRNLNFENQSLRAAGNKNGDPIIYNGDEEDFFPNEIREFILSALKNELVNIKKDTRKYNVINDVIESNEYSGELERRNREIKKLLSTYTSMDTKLRNSLKDLGFEISDEGKHYKLVYFGDGRYTFTIAKTPSDKGRAGRNNVSIINYTIY